MTPYKITYLINGLGSGGAEMMLYRLLGQLDRRQFEPTVIALLDLEGPVRSKIEALGIPVTVVGIKSKLDLLALYRLFNQLKKNKPQILQTQLFAADIFGRLVGRLLNIPVVITSIRNVYYGGKHRDLLIKWTDRFAMRTVFVSRQALERFASDSLVSTEKAKLIYNGLDPASFNLNLSAAVVDRLKDRYNIPKNKILLLAVGSLTRQKGYDVLFKALSLLNMQNNAYHLLIAGDGLLKKNLVDLTLSLGIDNQVTFLGRSDRVEELMVIADILVLASRWEGLPGVVMEAMAAKLPVVATGTGGTPELVLHGKTGLLAPPENSAVLAETMTAMINMEKEERRKMGLAGYNRVVENFTVKKMARSYTKLYLECLNTSKQERDNNA